MSILEQIIADKKLEVSQRKSVCSLEDLQRMPSISRDIISTKASLLDPESSGIIAEFKRKSPSKGYFNAEAKIVDICFGYQKAGAAVASVLTDQKYFGGSLEDLIQAREVLHIPILRKDFVIDPYQIYESRAFGADLILLIAAALSPLEVRDLAALAKNIGLEVLLEVHSLEELKTHACEYVDLLGVNNRNLKTFNTDLSLSMNLISNIPDTFLAVSESGLDNPDIVKNLRALGYKAFLIGECFMKTADPAQACADFIRDVNED
jgi:indole-3-glycerol phosphate synthase